MGFDNNTLFHLQYKQEAKVLCLSLTPCLQRTLTFKGLEPGEVNRTADIKISASGKAVNVARILQQLGGQAHQAGFLGGPNGSRVATLLVNENLTHDYIRTQTETRVCQTLIDSQSGEVTELVEEMVNPEPSEWGQFIEWLKQNANSFEDFVFAGSPPPGTPGNSYSRMMDEIRAVAGKSRFWVDSQKAPMLNALQAKPFMAKLNRREFETTIGAQFDSNEEAARKACEWLDHAEWITMTAGARGVWLLGKNASYVAIPPKIQAVNPIGSGDSMTAGMVQGLRSGLSMKETLRLGVACGAANALSSTSGNLMKDQLDKLLQHIQVEDFS